MCKKEHNRKYCWVLLPLFFLGLLLIRFYERSLFYDPFLMFFKGRFSEMTLPAFENGKLIFNLFFRYFLNTFLSLGIIGCLIRDRKVVKFILSVYIVLFMGLMAVFLFLILGINKPDNWLVFQVRRFLIHPVFLLLFLPALYYQKMKK